LVFNRGRKERKENWKWRGREIEEVQSFKYLGFMMDREGGVKEHIKELTRKGKEIVRKVWGMGERMCRDDLIRRWMLFKYLVQSVISYGVEIWGWEERMDLEKIMTDYIRWIFRLDFCTPRYILNKEIGVEKLKIGWGMRALRFEERVRRSEIGLVRECWREKREEGWRDSYGEERRKFYNRYGWLTEVGEDIERDLVQKELEMREWERKRSKEEGFEKIREARYNEEYKFRLAEKEIPRYLMKSSLEKTGMGDKVRALVRLRCGNLEEWNKYWLAEDKRKCSFCDIGRDNMEHYITECLETRGWFDDLGKNKEEIWDRMWSEDWDERKGEVLVRIWKEKEKIKRSKVNRRGCE